MLLLCVDLVSTLLILVVTYFGCAGLALSHALRRLGVVRVRGLVKTGSGRVHDRLFLSTTLAILFTFLLSLLLVGSVLP